MIKSLNYFPRAAVLLLTALLIFCFYGRVIFNINSTLLGGKAPDAIKNYWVVDYHLKYDNDVLDFTGSNFPVGEHYLYADGQISLILPIMLIKPIIDLSDYSIGIVNGALMLSMFLTPLICFLVFEKLNVARIPSILFALLMGFLSPQIYRFYGHYALGYTCFVPLTIYLLILIQSKKKIWYVAILCSVFIFSSFLHLYYFLILGGFIGLVFLIQKDDIRTKLFNLFLFLCSALIVLLLVRLTDNVVDRPKAPWGFLFYRSYWESILLPVNFPFLKWWSSSVFEIRQGNLEGTAYVGLLSAFTMVLYLFMTKFSGALKFVSLKYPLIIASIILLMFSMGWPFTLGLESLVKYLGPIQQFRSIGRFAWVFFYVFNFYALAWLSKNFLEFSKSIQVIVVFCAVVTCYHITLMNTSVESSSVVQRSVFKSKNLSFDFQDYEGVMPLKYVWVGSECIDNSGDASYHEALRIASTFGLPLVGNNLSRVSETRTYEMLRFVFGNDQEFLKSRNNILIVKEKNSKDSRYNQGLYSGDVVYEDDQFQYLSFNSARYLKCVFPESLIEKSLLSFNKEGVEKSITLEDLSEYEYLCFKFTIPKNNTVWPLIHLIAKGKEKRVVNSDYISRVTKDYILLKVPLSKSHEGMKLRALNKSGKLEVGLE